MRRVDGGRIISGTWHFASGIPYSTHHMGLIHEEGGTIAFVTPEFRRLDNWGDLIGLKGSGSHSVVVEEAFVPDRHVIPFGFFQDVAGGTVGSGLHDNPMYAGQFMAFAMGELNSVQVGTAQAMLDEAEEILTTRSTNPTGNRSDPGGGAPRRRTSTTSARSAWRCRGPTPRSRSWSAAASSSTPTPPESVAGGEPFMEERAMRVYGQLMTVQKLTWEAGDELFRTAELQRREGRRAHAALLARPVRVPHERPAPARLPRAGDRPRAVRDGRRLRGLTWRGRVAGGSVAAPWTSGSWGPSRSGMEMRAAVWVRRSSGRCWRAC